MSQIYFSSKTLTGLNVGVYLMNAWKY